MGKLYRLYRQAALVLLCGGIAFGQAVNGTIVGTVADSSGAAIPSAKVTLTEVNTKIVRSGITNQFGSYDFPDLPPGTYEVAVEVAGFKR